MGRLDRLRKQVAEEGIIPRRPGTELPTEVYYLRVAELQQLVDDPSLAEEYIARAKARSKKRTRAKKLKNEAVAREFGPAGQSQRVALVLEGEQVQCLGRFTHETRFVSHTGFARARHGYVYQVDDRRRILSESEAEHAWVRLGIPKKESVYREPDLNTLIWEAGPGRTFETLLREETE